MTTKFDETSCTALIEASHGDWFSDSDVDAITDQLEAALGLIAQLRAKRVDTMDLVKRAFGPPGERHAGQRWCGGVRIDQPLPLERRLCFSCERERGSYMSPAPTPVETNDDRYLAWSAYLRGWSLTYPCRLELRAEKQELGNDGAAIHNQAMEYLGKPGDASASGYYLRIGFHYPDERDSRDGVSPVPVGSGLGLWPPSLYPDENTPRWLRANLKYHLEHELDEHLRLDGERLFDPHHESIYQCDACIAKERLLDIIRDPKEG